MLTFAQIATIASILGWTTDEVLAGIAELNNGFMRIDIQEFVAGDYEEIEEDGIFARLSAPGYLDCTDWDGPFDTEEQAVASLLNVYAD